jgi:ankyrin repeat protein
MKRTSKIIVAVLLVLALVLIGFSFMNYLGSHLHEVVQQGNSFLVRLSLLGGADVNELIADERVAKAGETSPLFIAMSYNANEKVVRHLLKAGADIDFEYYDGSTVWFEAAQYNSHPHVIRLLVDAGCDVHDQFRRLDAREGTALMYAILYNSPEVVQALIDIGSDVNAENYNNYRPLHVAITSYSNADIVKKLLQAGADVSWRTRAGETPLHIVVQDDLAYINNQHSDVPQIVSMLIEAGVDVHARTKSGKTLLHYLATNRDLSVIEQVMGMVGPSVMKDPERDMNEYLIEAARANDNPESIHYFLGKGADINTRDAQQRTALIAAAQENEILRSYSTATGFNDIIAALIAAGSDIKAKDNRGMTAFDHLKKRYGDEVYTDPVWSTLKP